MSCFRRVLLPALAVVIGAGTLAVAADVLSQFHLTEEDAQQAVFETVWEGRPQGFSGATSVFRALSSEARVAAVTAGAAFIRTYCESDAFRERYAAMRQSQRPVDITAKTQTDAQVDAQAAESLKALKQMQEAMKNMPPEVRKMAEAAMKEAGATGTVDQAMAESSKAVNKAKEEQKAANAKAAKKIAEHQLSQKEFDQRYPANPERYIAARLREFLDLTASVPFDAPMVSKGGKRYFADPALESKPDLWKRLYRAGKPSVDAARTAASAWLAKLEGKG